MNFLILKFVSLLNNWCGKTFKKDDRADQRFCSESCEHAHDQWWEETKTLRYEFWKRDYENWLRIRPVYGIYNGR